MNSYNCNFCIFNNKKDINKIYKVMGLFIPSIINILTPTVVKKIMKYVFEENDVDKKVKKLQKRISKLEKKIKEK